MAEAYRVQLTSLILYTYTNIFNTGTLNFMKNESS